MGSGGTVALYCGERESLEEQQERIRYFAGGLSDGKVAAQSTASLQPPSEETSSRVGTCLLLVLSVSCDKALCHIAVPILLYATRTLL
jgi:hypothetical protein